MTANNFSSAPDVSGNR